MGWPFLRQIASGKMPWFGCLCGIQNDDDIVFKRTIKNFGGKKMIADDDEGDLAGLITR